jgi:hypothetical protein
MTTILSTYFPTQVNAQYWFVNGSQDYFTLEDDFVFQDFILIDLYNSYTSGKDILEDLSEFLLRMDTRGVNWLLLVPDTEFVKQIFSEYHFRQLASFRRIRPLCITNYLITT